MIQQKNLLITQDLMNVHIWDANKYLNVQAKEN